MLQKIHSHGEGQKKDDAQGKGACHKKQILPAGPCMMKAQGGVDSEQLDTSGSLDRPVISCASRYCGQRGDPGRFSGRSAGSQKHSQQSHDSSGKQAWDAYGKCRHGTEIFRA